MKSWIKIFVGTVLLSLSGVLIITFIIKNQEDSFADEIISSAAEKFEKPLKQLINDSNDAINELRAKIENEKEFSQSSLTQDISKLILNNNTISGIALSGNKFSFIIYREKSSWVVTYDTTLNDSISDWYRLNNRLDVVSSWTDIYKAFPSSVRIDELREYIQRSDYLWLSSEKFSNEHGNTINVVFNSDNKRNGDILTAVLYRTEKLSSGFSEFLEFEMPLVTLIAENNTLITPLVTSDTLSISRYNLLTGQIEILVNKWASESKPDPKSFSFEKFDKTYWTRIVGFAPVLGLHGFAVTISATDLALTENKQERYYLFFGVGSAFAGLLVFLLLLKRSKKSTLQENSDLLNEDILSLIRKGETEFVEFKSSLRWDFNENKVNKVLETVILKSINAFANAKGGKLFIGVDDGMNILGLEKDLSSLPKQNIDYFELHLRGMAKSR